MAMILREGQLVPILIGAATLERLGMAYQQRQFTVEDVEVAVNRAIEAMLDGDKPKRTRKTRGLSLGSRQVAAVVDTITPPKEHGSAPILPPKSRPKGADRAPRGMKSVVKANKMLAEMHKPERLASDFKGLNDKREFLAQTEAVYKRWLAMQSEKEQ